jgi:phage FluMu gp28-like protein
VPAYQVLDSARIKVQPAVDGDFMRLYPHTHHVDGFFAAVMVRAAATAKPDKPDQSDLPEKLKSAADNAPATSV